MKPFDPLELARQTESVVCRGDERKYTDFYATGVYGGIATGYTCGCCLRCIFCWVDFSREYPEKYGRFYTPEQAFRRLEEAAHRSNVRKLRISGAEPTLGKEHLLGLLKLVEPSDFGLFILETNGIILGADVDYVKSIAKFGKVHVRVSLKAGTPAEFTRKTGATPEAFELPFKTIQYLRDFKASFHVAAMSADPRLMTPQERKALIKRLSSIDTSLVLNLEEEVADPYQTTLTRLEYAGLELKWPIQNVYKPPRLEDLAGARTIDKA